MIRSDNLVQETRADNLVQETRPNLLGWRESDLEQFLVDCGNPGYRAKQIFTAIFKQRVAGFDAISTLPKSLRQQLSEHFDTATPTLALVEASIDGTRKYRFESDGAAFESVYIPAVARNGKTNTLCVSSQTGCALGCGFCYTASLRHNRNLTAAEIVGQVLAVSDDLATIADSNDGVATAPRVGVRPITNIVYMGMGEPLLNYEEVVRSVEVLMERHGADYSNRRITVSTAGIVPRIYDLARDLQTQLAVSLNATTDEVRDRIMPINKKWPLAKLVGAMRDYPLPNRRRITIEYVMLGGINDSDADARRLIKLLAGLPVKINLLPLNEHERTPFETPSPQRVEEFQRILHKARLSAIVRSPRGQDISAACGQLGAKP